MHRLIDISNEEDIPAVYQNTPIGLLLEYHNLNRPLDQYESAQLLIGMCMDNRNQLRIPNNFTFIIRDGGANLNDKAFKLSFVVSVGGVRHFALIGHSDCGMVGLESKRDKFVSGLVSNGGWSETNAIEHFQRNASEFEIGDAVGFVIDQVKRLRVSYPGVTIVPMYYKVEDHRLYLIEE